MAYFYNWLWQVYRYNMTRFEEMTPNEQLELLKEFCADCK